MRRVADVAAVADVAVAAAASGLTAVSFWITAVLLLSFPLVSLSLSLSLSLSDCDDECRWRAWLENLSTGSGNRRQCVCVDE